MGADIHLQDNNDGWTALMCAANQGHTQTVTALGKMGADVHQKNKDDETALMLAARHGYTKTVTALGAMGG
jgi:ankyrin repeat protein